MLKIKHENDETEQHSFQVIAPRPLDVQFKNNEISTIEEYLVKNEVDNTYEVLKRHNVLKIKQETDETEEHSFEKSFEVIEPEPLNVQLKKNEISTTEENLVKNEGDNTYGIHFPCNATDTSNNTKTVDGNFIETIKNNSEQNIYKIRRFDCNMCQKRFTTKSNIIRHIAQSHSSTSIGKKTPQKNNVNHRNKNGLFNCGIYLKSFSSISSLRRHWRIHTDEKPFKCNVCEKTFCQQTSLKSHKSIHTGEKPFKCNICEKTFGHQSSLYNHKSIHTGEKPFKCNICEKTFGHQSSLKIHKRVHTGEKPFKCDVCGKTFGVQSLLKTHKRIHTEEKPFKCNVCAKTFRQQPHLNNHKRIHTGEKPFKCDVCGKTFGVQSSLKTHERIHTEEKRFKCNVCAKTFRQQSHLNNHKRIHIGGVRYKCSVCEKSYGHQDSLKRHQAKVHDS